ncbi:hypothetical protein WJ968_33985 [Achromobacter xylosoxidans]
MKGANHFRAGYRRLAAQIISVDSVGLSTADITSFPRERLVGEYWPLSDRAALEDKQGPDAERYRYPQSIGLGSTRERVEP